MPEDAVVYVAARRDDDGLWEAIVPEFSIAGMGRSSVAAFINSMELLDDYLFLCSREGKTFEESMRPISRRSGFPIARELIGILIRSRARRSGPRREEEYRVPLRAVAVH